MPVKHALLALLADRDLTGYELKIRFERALGEFWQLNSGQVYSTLERLRQCGLVQRYAADGAVERTRYALTARGRRQLDHWLVAPAPRLRPVRDPMYVKVVFSSPERTPALLAAFNGEARRYGEALEVLTALVAREPMSFAGRTRWLAAEAVRLSYEAQLKWIDSVRRVLATHAAEAAAVAARPRTRRGHPVRGAHPLTRVAERAVSERTAAAERAASPTPAIDRRPTSDGIADRRS